MAPPDRSQLREFIEHRFNRDELGQLCSDYFPDFYRDYDGTNIILSSLTSKLVEWCERRETLENLRLAVHKARSDVYEQQFGRPRITEVAVKPRNPKQVFISHAHEDAEFGTRLAQDLREAGLSVWIAPDSIQPGEMWAKAIDRGLRESGIFVVVLSPSAAASGWVEHEMFIAIGYERKKQMQFIPLMAQACDLDALPALLQPYQFVPFEADYAAGLSALMQRLGVSRLTPLPQDLADALADTRPFVRKGAIDELVSLIQGKHVGLAASARVALEKLADDDSKSVSSAAMAALQATRLPPPSVSSLPPVGPLLIDLPKLSFRLQLVRIPAGPFLMGSDKSRDSQACDNELPQHTLTLPEYLIGKYAITNAQFAVFVKSTSYKTTAEKEGTGVIWTGKWEWMKGADWQHPNGPSTNIDQKSQHPVVQVSLYDAIAFCEWLSRECGRKVTLPTEPEWEKAARSADGRIYLWGNDAPDATRGNFYMNVKDTTPVGQYSPNGDSPFGCADMAGNTWDWTRSLWGKDVNTLEFKYPYVASDGREDLNASDDVRRVVRGGSLLSFDLSVRAAVRNGFTASGRFVSLGFRVVISAPG